MNREELLKVYYQSLNIFKNKKPRGLGYIRTEATKLLGMIDLLLFADVVCESWYNHQYDLILEIQDKKDDEWDEIEDEVIRAKRR